MEGRRRVSSRLDLADLQALKRNSHPVDSSGGFSRVPRLSVALCDDAPGFGGGEVGCGEGLADEAVAVEVDLPVAIGVSERADDEDGAGHCEGADGDFGGGVRHDVRDSGQLGFE